MDLLIKAFDVAKRIYDAVQTERSNSEEAIALRNDVKIIMAIINGMKKPLVENNRMALEHLLEVLSDCQDYLTKTEKRNALVRIVLSSGIKETFETLHKRLAEIKDTIVLSIVTFVGNTVSSPVAAIPVADTRKSQPLDIPTLQYDDFHGAGFIGRGGYASVYRALYAPTDGSAEPVAVALKVLDANADALQHDHEVMEELKVHYNLRSPYVVRCRGLTVTPFTGNTAFGGGRGGRMAIVMELFAGSLNIVLGHKGYRFVPTAGRVWLARQVTCAVQFLKEKNIVHGDIKPLNFLWNVAGHGSTAVVKVSDFGNSRLQSTLQSMSVATGSSNHSVSGTTAWLAPELLMNGLGHNSRSDVYALGITLYEIAFGVAPFKRMNNAQIKEVVTSGSRPSLDLSDYDGDDDGLPSLLSGTEPSPAMLSLIADCWAADRKSRPSADKVMERLEDLPSDESSVRALMLDIISQSASAAAVPAAPAVLLGVPAVPSHRRPASPRPIMPLPQIPPSGSGAWGDSLPLPPQQDGKDESPPPPPPPYETDNPFSGAAPLRLPPPKPSRPSAASKPHKIAKLPLDNPVPTSVAIDAYNDGKRFFGGAYSKHSGANAASLFAKAAAGGSLDALRLHVRIYSTGHWDMYNMARALALMRQLAAMCAQGAYECALWLMARGTEFYEAEMWLQRAQVSGYVKASGALAALAALRLNCGEMMEHDERARNLTERLQQGADDGDAAAMFELGCARELGRFGLQIDEQGGRMLKLKAGSCAIPYGPAQAYYGEKKSSFEHLQTAAEIGIVDAQFLLGNECESRERINAAMWWWTTAVENGSGRAMAKVAMLTMEGKYGFIKDKVRAFKLAWQANEKGVPEGAMALAQCYMRGIGVSTNKNRAAELILRTAETMPDWTEAHYQAGLCYADGLGVKKDKDKAISILSRICEKHPGAMARLDKLLKPSFW